MKFSKYNMVVDIDGGILLYNLSNAKCVKIYKKEELNKFITLLKSKKLDSNDEMIQALYKRGYVVDDDVNEYEEVKKLINNHYQKSERQLKIMLYVTEQCNFRCTYCFQKHLNKQFSIENWDALYKYIEKNLKKGSYDSVTFAFFGGEPLLEVDKIINFLDRLTVLKELYPNIIFSHRMTTNGYLLTPDVYDKLVERDVLNYQITIDGFADTHDKTRPLVNGKGTWEKIIENFKYINSKNDKVYIITRVNISSVNMDKLESFIDWFLQNFNSKKFNLDLNSVSKFTDLVDDELIPNWESCAMQDLSKSTVQKTGADLSRCGFLSMACHCAALGFFAISVDGKIIKCEEATTDNYDEIGYLSKDGDFIFDSELIKGWQEGFETEDCPDCIIYPLCAGRSCPQNKLYNPNTREECRYKDKTNPVDIIVKDFLRNAYYSNSIK